MIKSLLRLWPFLSPHRGSLILALFLGIMLAQLNVILPTLVQIMIECLGQRDLVPYIPGWIKSMGFWPQMEEALKDHFFVVKCIAIFMPAFYLVMGVVRFLTSL